MRLKGNTMPEVPKPSIIERISTRRPKETGAIEAPKVAQITGSEDKKPVRPEIVLLEKLSPEKVAETLQYKANREVVQILQQFSRENAAAALGEMKPREAANLLEQADMLKPIKGSGETQAITRGRIMRLIKGSGNETTVASEILEKMEANTAAKILAEMNTEKAGRVLDRMSTEAVIERLRPLDVTEVGADILQRISITKAAEVVNTDFTWGAQALAEMKETKHASGIFNALIDKEANHALEVLMEMNKKDAARFITGAETKAAGVVDLIVSPEGFNAEGERQIYVAGLSWTAGVFKYLTPKEAAVVMKPMDIDVAGSLLEQMGSKKRVEVMDEMAKIKEPGNRFVGFMKRQAYYWSVAYAIGSFNMGVAWYESGNLPMNALLVAGVANVLAGKALRPFTFRGKERELRYPWNAITQTVTAQAVIVGLASVIDRMRSGG